MSNTIILERFAYAPDGTFGKLTLPSGEDFYTVERPWLNNKPFESCIPEGVYRLGLRYSPLIERLTQYQYTEGWEVQDVPERSLIMLHPGNWPIDFKGCIGLGLRYAILRDRAGIPRNAVDASRVAFGEFMELLDTQNHWDLEIIPKLITYP